MLLSILNLSPGKNIGTHLDHLPWQVNLCTSPLMFLIIYVYYIHTVVSVGAGANSRFFVLLLLVFIFLFLFCLSACARHARFTVMHNCDCSFVTNYHSHGIHMKANIPERDSLYGVTQCATINHQFYYKFYYRIHIKRDSNIEYYKIYLF